MPETSRAADPSAEPSADEDGIELTPIGETARYDALMEVIRNRATVRKFDEDYVVPDSHHEMILEAARHGPSGANAQPWQFIVVRDGAMKKKIADYFVEEQRRRAKAKMKFPTPDYRGLAAAPGYGVWWVTAIGQEEAQKAMRPLLGIPEEVSVLDIFLFGPPANPPYKRWRRPAEEIVHWDSYDRGQFMTDEDLADWIRSRRHRVMYKDASNVD